MGWKSKDGSVSFTSRVHGNQIELTLAASVKGPRSWLGIGVSKSGGMADADIVIGILNNDAKDLGLVGGGDMEFADNNNDVSLDPTGQLERLDPNSCNHWAEECWKSLKMEP